MNLTPDEELFFATGELPASMTAEAQEAAAAEPVVEKSAPVVVEPPKVEPAPDPMLAALERMQQQFDAKLSDLQEKLAAATKPAERVIEAPDDNTDPLGSMLFKLDQVNTQVASLQKELTTEQQNNLLRQQFDQFNNSVNEAKKQFEATTPDFKDAYAHIRTLRADDLRAAGAPEADIPKILLNDEFQLAQTAIQRGKNPAAEMYAMAKRYGYAPKTTAQKPAAQQTAEEKLEALRIGQKAARNPDKAGTESVLTLEGLKDASSEDLNKLVQDDKLWAQVMGGKGKDIF